LWKTLKTHLSVQIYTNKQTKNKQTEIENSCEFSLSEKFLIVVLDSLFEFAQQLPSSCENESIDSHSTNQPKNNHIFE
jgi:hypothetical protein